ncbi:hypothetical protein C3481_06455 [Microbacterium sp. Ru50]|uniref:hypothetical protein n=1 Tax=Microbacterium sp. Ru50 TaxID=2080744 RepID=UPI000CDD4C49|nr:hypothetical protein [Microbacterium sp. Ru50]POX67823.1 hypothetical protein C3481_06455 [Microbacterium sp. Ru50]
MFNYEIIVIDKTTNQLKRTTLEHLRAELDALSEASAMRVAVESEGRRVADMPGDMPGRDALIKQYGADYRVLPPPPPDFPDSDDEVVEYDGREFALVHEPARDGHPVAGNVGDA